MRAAETHSGQGAGLWLSLVLVGLVLATEAALVWGVVTDPRALTANLGMFVVMAGLLLAVGVAVLLVQDARHRLAEETARNARNQAAILRLLDELADLAEGDLRVHASVTENFTGAIADSINFAIDQTRGLVMDIDRLSRQVAEAADESRETARSLAKSSEHQAHEIAGASGAISEMAASIEAVSSNAEESERVAERAVEIASNGGEVVRNTIGAMDRIREQIQDTSKRIKRLGESSQEIGDIVSLIDDIADQTNILSLNAAIQASTAGEAGRGFAVVADEVQRLAERAGAATKRISALVKTIQRDTSEAVTSMEQTTSEVVGGARLTQDAGVALEEIETVSKSLATRIQSISTTARRQTTSASHASDTMRVIREITHATSESTNATAQSIGELAGMASEMRRSVAGFKLPESAAGSAPARQPSTAEETRAELDSAPDATAQPASV